MLPIGGYHMTRKLTTTDLLAIQAQILFGSQPAPGTDPFSNLGLRSVDGTFNNISHLIITDQYGDVVNTNSFANSDVPFVYFTAPIFAGAPGSIRGAIEQPGAAPAAVYSQGVGAAGDVVDYTPRIISNLVVDMAATNPAVPASAFGNPGDPALFITPYNGLMTIFGQFFDHGLDFIAKGGNGTITIPLLPGDPNYVVGGPNVMFETRATIETVPTAVYPVGLTLSSGQIGVNINTTAPLVDQSQTYGSTLVTQFYLMEYDANGNATGRLVTHAGGGMATWADIKANALHKGIILVDTDVLNIPTPVLANPALPFNLATNPYGADRSPTGLTGQMFLADIAHNADPTGKTGADADGIINGPGPVVDPTKFDNELLDVHLVAGDPRANENVALTAIHAVFHDEHNRLVDQIKDLIQQENQIVPTFAAQWTGEQIFQAAKFANEMQYQHMVFQEFARHISPNIDAFAQYNVTLNPNITSEFANAVYRLGHSMLTDTVDMVNAVGEKSSVSLVTAFLNPTLYAATGPADILKGMSEQVGNQVDEFVVDSLRNFLVGLPLDLAALNIARGRDAGVPTLNEVRTDLFSQTKLTSLQPYTSWDDFGANLLNPGSLVNFVAAYAQDTAIKTARLAGDYATARSLAQTHINADDSVMTGGDLGYNDIDLWLGGLAEAKVLPGGISPGMLGSTFDFIFATQMLALQNGDRLYYLGRGLPVNLLNQIDAQTFSDLEQRGTGLTHVNGDAFGTADLYLELSALNPNQLDSNFAKTPAQAAAVVHEVIGGTHGTNSINAGAGNDTVWAEAGNDTVEGGLGNDHLYGGDGNDVITDIGGDDFIRGDAGDDTINAGPGIDIIFGGDGNDTVRGGDGADEVNGNDGNDVLLGDAGDDAMDGGRGNDQVDGGLGNDKADGFEGDDVLLGGPGVDILTGDVGNDFLIGGSGADAMDGGLGGYDIVSYESTLPAGPGVGLTINMTGVGSTGDAQGDTFVNIEEVRGTLRDDTIIGDGLDNVLLGEAGNDSINGGAGNDTLIGGAGNDQLIGGGGIDTATYSGVRANYTFTAISVSDNLGGIGLGPDGVDTLTGISFLEFADQIVNIATGLNVPAINFVSPTNVPANPFSMNGTQVNASFISPVDLVDGTALSGFVGTQGINLGKLNISEPSGPNGVRTFALAGDDAASFQVVTTAGGVSELHFIGGGGLSFVNYEVKPEYFAVVSVTDGNGTSSINVVVNVQDVNDNAPVITTNGVINVQENTVNSTVVYRGESSDLDSVGSQIWSLQPGGADNGQFSFTGGELRFNTTPNFENPLDSNHDNVYEVMVGVADGAGPGSHLTTQLLHINVTDVAEGANAAPTFAAPLPANPTTVVENTAIATPVFDFSATDLEGDALFWSIVDDTGAPVGHVGDAGFFTIDANGAVRFLNNPDFENPAHASPEYYLTVRVTDASHGVPVNTQNLHVVIQNVIESVVFTTANPSPVLWAENQAPAAVVYDANATGTGAVTYSIVPVASGGGADAAQFSINSTTGVLTFLTSKNFEAPTDAGADGTYNVTIRATDTSLGTADQAIAVTLTNVNEAPSITSVPPATPILWPENTAAANVLYGAVATDPDAGTVLNYVLGGLDAALFTVNGAGQIRFNASPNFEAPLDNGANNVYNITLTASDGALSSAAQPVSIQVTNVAGVTLVGDPGGVPTADVLTGTSEPDSLSGLLLGDILNGLDGNDSLDGGAGIDTMTGGTGDDTYFVDDPGDVVVELLNEGTDLVNSVATFYALAANVENLTLTGAVNQNGTGNDLANVITGNAANNIIEGLGGGDVLNGGAGIDTVSYANSTGPVSVDLTTNLVSGGHAQGDIVSNFENVIGSGFADTLVGTAVANVLDGRGGIDTMTGLGGNDTYFVDQQGDIIVEAIGGGTDTAVSSASVYFLGLNVENLTLAPGAGGISGQGNSLANVMVGNEGVNTLIGLDGNDTLDGGVGADVLLGGVGNDLYRVDDTFDLVDEGIAFPAYAGGAADVDTIASTSSWFWDVYSVGEVLQVDPAAVGSTTIIGSMFSNQMIGNAGDNVLFGRGGSDTYRAGDGIDYISLSTLGLTDANSYVGVDGVNTIIIDKRTTGAMSYDIVFEFDVAKDRVNVQSYGFGNAAQVLATGHNDGAGNSYFALGDGLDYLYLVGVTVNQVTAANFII